ncbi:hypothetical protein KL86DES1_22175 [uncultured Desulfovibrio sp.]|uniref:Uncharacterized protein n=1 Tax=uncultured Desulfovibrio sp. TaxID=167968 RepID=A0A212LB69_9BACT|nr:hypothetical protein KL86DES1_22175 [uncultured Desulfovibrio sp.]
MRISILNAFKTPAPARNSSNKLRLRLRGGRLLPHPPEQFQREIALKAVQFFKADRVRVTAFWIFSGGCVKLARVVTA